MSSINLVSMRIDTHHHHRQASSNLAFVFFLNLSCNIIVIIGALLTNSMAILADCIHDTSDTISMAIAWILEHIAQRDSSHAFSYGYQRFSILGAVITSTFVIISAIFILSESIPRLFSPEPIDAGGMLVVGILGLVFKSISVWKLHGGETFNEKAILYHLLGDIFEWVAILILSIVLIFWKDAYYLDPIVSIGIAIWLIVTLGKTLFNSFEVLLQKTPKNFDVNEFKENILAIDDINAIDDFHIWSLDGIDSVMTLKVAIDNWENQENIKKEIYDISNKYHVVDITIEFD